MKRAFLIALVSAFVLTFTRAVFAQNQGSEADDFKVSKEGRRFRIRFDPESRIRLGIASSGSRAANGRPEPGLELSAGISVRRRYGYGEGPVRVEWQFDQRILTGYIAPTTSPFGDMRSLDATLYGAFAHRHDLSPRIVLPSSPPASIPFPFDIGVEGEIGRVWVPRAQAIGAPDGKAVPLMRIGVARGTGFVDPWRANAPGRSLEIGVGVRYDIDLYGARTGTGAADSINNPRIVHRVAPMTATSIRFRFETQDGLLQLDARGEVIPHWTSEGTWKVAGLGYVRAERTLIAIEDQPIAAFFESSYRLIPAALEILPLHDVRVSLGITLGIDLTPGKRVIDVKSDKRLRGIGR